MTAGTKQTDAGPPQGGLHPPGGQRPTRSGGAWGPHSTLGQDVPQVNARAKVLGRAQYAGDLKVAGMLHAAVLRLSLIHI